MINSSINFSIYFFFLVGTHVFADISIYCLKLNLHSFRLVDVDSCWEIHILWWNLQWSRLVDVHFYVSPKNVSPLKMRFITIRNSWKKKHFNIASIYIFWVTAKQSRSPCYLIGSLSRTKTTLNSKLVEHMHALKYEKSCFWSSNSMQLILWLHFWTLPCFEILKGILRCYSSKKQKKKTYLLLMQEKLWTRKSKEEKIIKKRPCYLYRYIETQDDLFPIPTWNLVWF